jgi:hypothetical protein
LAFLDKLENRVGQIRRRGLPSMFVVSRGGS